MVAIPWQYILISPLGITLTMFSTIMFIFLFSLMRTTPAMIFFKAKFGKKMILINPDEDRRLVFRVANKDSDMAYVKNKGYYIIDPNHVSIESSSKIPTAIVYGSFGESIGSEDAEITEKLKSMGVNNYIELIDRMYNDITADTALKIGLINKQQYDEQPNKIYKIPKENNDEVKIFGKTVSFDNVVKYFSKNTRADLIESKIQHRISAMKMEKLGGKAGDIFKWAVILVIVIIGGALAYNMITMGKVNPQQAQQVGGIVGQAVNQISGATNGTALV